MKVMQRAISLMLVGVFMSATPTSLWAESDAIGGGFLTIDKNAVGTKVYGPLSVYYDVIGTNAGGCLVQVAMSFTMKLKKGAALYAFASPTPTTVCYENHTLQVAIIQAFFANTVIPNIFACSNSPNVPNPCPPFALKDVTNVVSDGSPQTAPPFFTLMDITLAVRE